MTHYTLSAMSLLVCATLSTNLHALSRDGLYLGAGIGASFDKFDLTSRNTMTGFKVNSPSIDKTNGLGDVFIGFGGTAQNGFYLGGELGTYFPKRDSTVYNRPGVTLTALTFNNKLKVQDYLTADVLPGYRMNEDWLIYGRLGLSYANLSIYQWPTIASPSFDSDEKK